MLNAGTSKSRSKPLHVFCHSVAQFCVLPPSGPSVVPNHRPSLPEAERAETAWTPQPALFGGATRSRLHLKLIKMPTLLVARTVPFAGHPSEPFDLQVRASRAVPGFTVRRLDGRGGVEQ